MRTPFPAAGLMIALAASLGGVPQGAAATTDSLVSRSAKAPAATRPAAAAAAEPMVAVLETAQGTIVFKFRDDVAPRTAANFRKLAKQKFYDGTYFHRVIPGFMIQGGDPNTRNTDETDDGLGGPGYTTPAEIKLQHVRGAVATARTGDNVNPKRESSGSQFFIDVAAQPSLDRGGYTVFGQVIAGLAVVDKIVKLPNSPNFIARGGQQNPGKAALIKSVRIEPLSKWTKP